MSEITDMLARIVAMQKEAMPVPCDAVPFWPYQQENFPYFVNRLAPFTSGDRIAGAYGAEDIEENVYTIDMQLIIGHITSGYEGERQSEVYEWIPLIREFFREHPMLTSTAFPTEPDYLSYEAEFTGSPSGLVVFANAGLDVRQLGVSFSLTVPYVAKAY